MNSRNAISTDFARILELNDSEVDKTSPLNPLQLAELDEHCAYHKVMEIDQTITGFLLGFREGAAYQSSNYAWFSERYSKFLYVDRIVIDSKFSGRGIGRALYRDFFASAEQQQLPVVLCEYNIKPMNEASKIFHQKMGFVEVGQRDLENSAKRVSMQAREIA